VDGRERQIHGSLVCRNGLTAIFTSAVPQLLQQRWQRLAKWPLRLVLIAAVLVGAAWITIGLFVLLALAGSPLGCPPTMGCPERKTNCSTWTAFMQPGSTREVCEGGR